MTEGIIQEVIKKWRQKFIDGNVSLDSLLIEVEKELIEKIKQEFEPTQIDGFNMNMSIKTVIKILIGDGKRMTDGIIQEVIDSIISKSDPKFKIYMKEVERELIEKINAETMLHFEKTDWIEKKNLIGDKQE